MICGIMLFPRFIHYWRKVNSKREVNSLFHDGNHPGKNYTFLKEKPSNLTILLWMDFFFQFAFSLLLNAALYQGLHRLLKHN